MTAATSLGDARQKHALAPTDLVGIVVIVAGVLAIWAMQLLIVPSFAAMFQDFGGGEDALPALTLAAIRPVIASASTVLAALLCGAGLAMRLLRGRMIGTLLIGIGAFVPALTVPVMLYAMYLPIFAVAGAISP